MLSALGATQRTFDLSLLAFPDHADDLRARFPFADVLAWPYGQAVKFNESQPHSQSRPRGGALSKLFDLVPKWRPKKRYGPRSEDTAEVDGFLRQHEISALHFPASLLFDTNLPFIYEPWDLQHVHYPEFFKPEEHAIRDHMYRAGCERADLVVTATEWIKKDIVAKYGIDPRKIVTIRRSSLLLREQMSEEETDAHIARLGIPHDFIFYPAMCFEHKNHARLFKVMSILRSRGLVIPLVLSGRPHKPYLPMFRKAIVDSGVSDQTFVLGAVSDAALAALFRRARFMMFPSLFEGLGLPVLEAFYHGLPVLAARATCLPELVDDAAILFDPFDEEEMAHAIQRAWQHPEVTAHLPERGKRRLVEFSWERGIVLLQACYKHVLRLPMTRPESSVFAQARAS
jgi:glycosyltransferase involved in cell wall biosynthesis